MTSSIIKPKRRAVDASPPAVGDLLDGEIAISVPGKTIYISSGGAIIPIANFTVTEAPTWGDIAGKPTTIAGFGITDAPTKTGSGASGTWNISITGKAPALTTPRTIGLTGAATGTPTAFDGSGNINIPVTGLNANDLNAGTIPDARLSGTYTGMSLKVAQNGSVFSVSGTATDNRVASHLVSFRSGSSAATGCIVFSNPGVNTVMYLMHVYGMIHGGTENIVDFLVKGYTTTGGWTTTQLQQRGTNKPMVRLGRTPTGAPCLIIGEVDSVWSYPHFAIDVAMFSHSGADDPIATGWSSALVTDLTGYTSVSAALAESGVDISGNAATATALQTARTINGTSFDGTAAITTDNWGASREITIGGTSKPVNGSANVGWSLSEIGAAAESHTHTAAQITDLSSFTGFDARYYTEAEVGALLDAKAPLESPTFTGTPTAPTPLAGDDSEKLATTAFVQAVVAGGGAGAGSDVQVFTSSGTWTKPEGVTWVRIILIGGGGGGGGGRKGPNNADSYGGGGGGGGAMLDVTVLASSLGGTEAVTVGAGGGGGAGATVNSTNGSNASSGGDTWFGTSATNGFNAAGGAFGYGGTTTSGPGGGISVSMFYGGRGGTAALTNPTNGMYGELGTTSSSERFFALAPIGGGAGGSMDYGTFGLSTFNGAGVTAPSFYGNGSSPYTLLVPSTSGATAGGAGGTIAGYVGYGGGGSGAQSGAAGGDGGLYGGGGGGGGAGLNGNSNGGNGGNGGNGIAIIASW